MFLKSAQLYDLFYSGKDYAPEAQKLHQIIKAEKQSSGNALLDVACGTGKHIQFLKRLYQCEGLDLNDELLDCGRRNNPEVAFHQADMVTFELNKCFDAITCLFSAIGYTKTTDNLERAVANMSRHLQTGGVLIIEPWFDKESYHPGMAHAVFMDQPGLKACRMNVSQIDGNLSILAFNYLIAVEDGGVEHFTERHELGLFSNEQHMQAFRKSGLEVSYDPVGLIGRGLFIGVKQ